MADKAEAAADEKRRDQDLSKRKAVRDKLLDLYDDIKKGFIDQGGRSDDQMDYWDIYDCDLNEKQYYSGNSQIFVPIVHNAVDARKTRFTNQIFPRAGRCVDVIDNNGDPPYALMALAEHYVRKAKLRTMVAPALNKNGDIEGQYNCYVDWQETRRHVTWRVEKPVDVEGLETDAITTSDIESDILVDAHPVVEVLPDADVLILPPTADGVDDALKAGGSVTVIRRWSKGNIKRMLKRGEIRKDEGDALLAEMTKAQQGTEDKNIDKAHVDAAGIKGAGKYALGYETWSMLETPEGLRLCKTFFGGDKIILKSVRNPFWNDRCPVISVPVEKISHAAKGVSKVKAVQQVQYAANDAINEGMDSAAFALLPIITVDPTKVSRTGSMILDLAAIWEVDPNAIKFQQFPQLWKDAFEIVTAATNTIFQTLSVNPAMIPQSTGRTNKRNQAEIANEQAVDVLTTADAVAVQEEGVFTPIIERFMEYDAQFRDSEIMVKAFGQMGQRAKMETIPPLQMGRRYEFRWFGVEQARNVAAVQQQIAAINVVRGVPPNLYKGRTLDLTVVIERVVEAAFGPRDAPLIFRNEKDFLSTDPEQENEYLLAGHVWPVSPMDNDQEHLQVHMAAGDDPHGTMRQHVAAHLAQMAAKAQQAQQQGQPGNPGTPGGAGPGVPGQGGAPQPGAQPAGPRQGKGPPGTMSPDRMPAAGAAVMPRKM